MSERLEHLAEALKKAHWEFDHPVAATMKKFICVAVAFTAGGLLSSFFRPKG